MQAYLYNTALDLELQGNDNTSETETYVTIQVETEVQNEEMDPEAISETPDGTTAISAELKKWKCFERLPGKDLRSRQRKWKQLHLKGTKNLISEKMFE